MQRPASREQVGSSASNTHVTRKSCTYFIHSPFTGTEGHKTDKFKAALPVSVQSATSSGGVRGWRLPLFHFSGLCSHYSGVFNIHWSQYQTTNGGTALMHRFTLLLFNHCLFITHIKAVTLHPFQGCRAMAVLLNKSVTLAPRTTHPVSTIPCDSPTIPSFTARTWRLEICCARVREGDMHGWTTPCVCLSHLSDSQMPPCSVWICVYRRTS